MQAIVSVAVQCPYCGETVDLLVDCSVDSQHYIEDCLVCCRPMDIGVRIDTDGVPNITAAREDDV